MTARGFAPTWNPRTISEVREGDRTQLGTGEWVTVGASLNSSVIVRRDSDGPRQGPSLLSPSTPVIGHQPRAASVGAPAVADPLAGIVDDNNTLFNRETT